MWYAWIKLESLPIVLSVTSFPSHPVQSLSSFWVASNRWETIHSARIVSLTKSERSVQQKLQLFGHSFVAIPPKKFTLRVRRKDGVVSDALKLVLWWLPRLRTVWYHSLLWRCHWFCCELTCAHGRPCAIYFGRENNEFLVTYIRITVANVT